MTQQTDQNTQLAAKDLQKTQTESASKTLLNAETEREIAKTPAPKKARVYETYQPGSSMSMLTPTGRSIIFRDGKCITKDPVEIAYLDGEIAAGHPSIKPEVVEIEDAKTVAEMIREAEIAAVENYKRQTLGASASAGTSSNEGAGSVATTANASVAAINAPVTAVDALKQKIAAAKAQDSTSDVKTPEEKADEKTLETSAKTLAADKNSNTK